MLLPTLPDPVPGEAEGFANDLLANFDQFRTNDQGIEDRLEGTFDSFFGQGVIEHSYTSPVVAAGSGLSANVGALVALIGFAEVPASGTVVLPASTASTVWLDQYGQLLATDGTDPTTPDNKCIVIGTATTDPSGVTAVSDTFTIVKKPGSGAVGGTVTSVALTLPADFAVSGSPVTTNGTLAGSWVAQGPGKALMGPASGADATPSFRALQIADLPALPAASNTVGTTLVVAASNSLAPARADAAYRCDGTADDVEVQAALAALAATGGRVVLLEGTYNFSAMVTVLGSNLALEGQGPGTVIRRGYNEPAGARALVRVGDNVTPLSNVAVRHLAFDGQKATYTTAGLNACIQSFLTTDLHIEDITAKNSTGYAVGISSGVKRAFVSNVHASGTDSQAVGLTSCNDVTVQNVFTTDCVGAVYGSSVNGAVVRNVLDAANRGSATVSLTNSNRFAVGGVHSDTSQSYGIALTTCTRFTLADCVIQAPALAGIYLTSCSQYAVSNCFIQSPASYGLYALTGSQYSIAGVNVKAAGNHGIYLSGATDATLANCTAVGNLVGNGFWLNGTNLAASGCEASGGVAVGFTVTGLSEANIVGCVARSNAGDGMNFSGACSRITVDGCAFTGNTGFGLNILSSYEVTVGSNTYGGNTAGDVREWGSLTAAAPNRFLGHGGSCVKVTANATLTGKESFVEVDASSGAVSVTLPTAGTNAQRNWRVTVKKVDSSANPVTLVNATDGVANRTLTVQYDSLSIVQDGLAYFLERSTQAAVGTESTLNFVIDGGGAAPTVGVKGSVVVDFACTIVSATLLADVSGSAVVDVRTGTYSGFPTVASICASAKPTLSSAQKSQDAVLTGWSKSIAAGSVILFNLDSVATVTRLTLALRLRRT